MTFYEQIAKTFGLTETYGVGEKACKVVRLRVDATICDQVVEKLKKLGARSKIFGLPYESDPKFVSIYGDGDYGIFCHPENENMASIERVREWLDEPKEKTMTLFDQLVETFNLDPRQVVRLQIDPEICDKVINKLQQLGASEDHYTTNKENPTHIAVFHHDGYGIYANGNGNNLVPNKKVREWLNEDQALKFPIRVKNERVPTHLKTMLSKWGYKDIKYGENWNDGFICVEDTSFREFRSGATGPTFDGAKDALNGQLNEVFQFLHDNRPNQKQPSMKGDPQPPIDQEENDRAYGWDKIEADEDFIIETDLDEEPVNEKPYEIPYTAIYLDQGKERLARKTLAKWGYEITDSEEEYGIITLHCTPKVENLNTCSFIFDKRELKNNQFLSSNVRAFYNNRPNQGETMSQPKTILNRVFGAAKGISSFAGLFFIFLWLTGGQPNKLIPNVSFGEEWAVIPDSIITENDEIVQLTAVNQWGQQKEFLMVEDSFGKTAWSLNPYEPAPETLAELIDKHLEFIQTVQSNPRLAGREIPGPTETIEYTIPAVWWD